MRFEGQFVKSCFRYFPGVILLLSIGGTQASDTRTGTVFGGVRDPGGAALEGVKVALIDESGRLVATTTSSSAGAYAFEAVESRKYELRAEHEGFRPAIPVIIDLSAQQKARVDLVLQPLLNPVAGHNTGTGAQGQTNKTGGYYQSSALKADEVVSAMDPAGYSSPADAATTTRLLEGAAALRQDSPARLDIKPEEAAGASPQSHGLRVAELETAVAKNLENASVIHDLGKLYLEDGKPEKAIPYLAEVYRLNPADRTNAFDLAVAYLRTGNLSAAQQQVQALLEGSDNAEFHGLLAEVEGKAGNFRLATQECQRAAQIEPSERNLFDRGTELLAQRNVAAGLEIFKCGLERYPKSPDMWIGRGIALYLRGDYDEAVRSLTHATDLNPTAYLPYVFLADASNASPKEFVAVAERLKRFAELYPRDARAVFYYTMSLWEGSRREGPQARQEEVEAQLKKCATLDPKFPDAHLQLGILYASQDKYPEAIEQYRQTIALDPESAAAHYKLGQALARTGHHEQAEQEFKLYEHLHQQPGAARPKDQGKEQHLLNLVKQAPNPAPE
jgi:tetratricopeptide (TPR) repeat protein